MADERTIAAYNEKAEDYARIVSADAPGKSLQNFIELMPQGGKVLDLGCGPGAASFHMQNAGLVPDPIDASESMIAIAKEKYGLNARIGHFDDVDGIAVYAGVWANFCLLHAPREDLPRYFKALFTALVPDGFLHVGMKTGVGKGRDAINRLYTYVATDELSDLFVNAGFEVTYIAEGEGAGLAGTIDPFVIMRGKKP